MLSLEGEILHGRLWEDVWEELLFKLVLQARKGTIHIRLGMGQEGDPDIRVKNVFWKIRVD